MDILKQLLYMNNTRTYETIRLFRGKRKGEELVMLSEAKRDFEFRRLFIEEVEQDLHVVFSRKIVSNWIAWIFLSLSILFLQIPLIIFSLTAIACGMKLYSTYCQKKFQKIFRGYKFSLGCVDAVIQNDYGITMPK